MSGKDRFAKAKERAAKVVPDPATRDRLVQGAARVGRAAKDGALDDVKDEDGKFKKGKVARRAILPTKTVRRAAENAKEAAKSEIQDIALEAFIARDSGEAEEVDLPED